MLTLKRAFIIHKPERRLAAALMAALLILTTALPAPAWQGSAGDEGNKSIELTVYNENLALVKETRPITLTLGLNQIRYADVPAMIDPTSVRFASRTSPAGTRVLEQNYEYDPVSYTHLRAHETVLDLVCRLLLEKKTQQSSSS